MQAVPRAPGEFAVTRNADGSWYFETIGARGEILLMSQAYVVRASALNGILSVEENGVDLAQYKVSQDSVGNWRFELLARNYEVIAESQLYSSEHAALAGVQEARDLIAGILRFKAAVQDGARFDLWRDQTTREWHFALQSEEGETLLRSEAYTGRTGAVNGIESVRLNGKIVERYRVREAGSQAYFILVAGNGHEIAESILYDSIEAAEAGIETTRALLASERVANPW
jgi:uncharacterized protein YegP (UPF0339 family)